MFVVSELASSKLNLSSSSLLQVLLASPEKLWPRYSMALSRSLQQLQDSFGPPNWKSGISLADVVVSKRSRLGSKGWDHTAGTRRYDLCLLIPSLASSEAYSEAGVDEIFLIHRRDTDLMMRV